MIEIILVVICMSLVASTMFYRKLFHSEKDKRLKHEVRVKNLILEHSQVLEEIKRA